MTVVKTTLILALMLAVTTCAGDGGADHKGTLTNPYRLQIGQLKTADIGRHEHAYFTFTPSSTGFHEIRLSALQSNLDWLLYRQDDFTDLLTDCDFSAGTADEACSAVTAAATPYYLEVVEKDSVDGSFAVSVTED